MRLLEVDEDKLLHSLDYLRTPMTASSSPTSLVVLAPMKQKLYDDDADDGQQEASSSEEVLPPLRCLSVSTRSSSTYAATTNTNDADLDACDSSSVSSVSLEDFKDFGEEDDSETDTKAIVPKALTRPVASKRCIFASYWEKKGGRPKQLPLQQLSTCQEDQAISESDAAAILSTVRALRGQNYEDLLEETEAPASPSRSSAGAACDGNSTSPRRRLWADNRYVSQYQSEPSLAEAALLLPAPTQPILRKTQSTPAVGQQRSSHSEAPQPRRASCLRRQCRFSGTSRRASSSASLSTSPESPKMQRRSSESTVVSFSDHVEVKYVKVSKENFASPGWSQYFM